MAAKFRWTHDQRRELAQLFARVIEQIGEGKQDHKRIHLHVGRYEATAWPREREMKQPRDPKNAVVHAILCLVGRAPSATAIRKFLREFGQWPPRRS